MRRRKIILLVEDDLVDALTVKRALDEVACERSIVHVSNGEAAMDYLRSEVNAKPFLILLDLNMPRMNGIEFLKAVKADPHLSRIPVVVLTTSKSRLDIIETFESSAAGYMTKPIDFREFADKIRIVEDYWQINRLPDDEWEALDGETRAHLVG